MPISINVSKEKGIEFSGVRAILAISGLFILCYLSAKGNQLATGALIPILQKLLQMYAEGQNGGVHAEDNPVALPKAPPTV